MRYNRGGTLWFVRKVLVVYSLLHAVLPQAYTSSSMKYPLSVLLGLCALLLCAACDTGSSEDESGLPNGTLLFVARDTTVIDHNGWRGLLVYKADLRTGRTVALTSPDDFSTGRGPAFEAIWSPDGRRIVYHEASGIDAGHLTIMNADGTGKRLLSDPKDHRALPMWGPDDRTVFYDQRVYLSASVGFFALDVETAPASDPVCVLCSPRVRFGAEPFVVDGDTIGGAIAPGSASGLVILASPLVRPPPMIGDYDVHLYEADYRTRKVLRRLTEQPIHGDRFVVAPGGKSVLFTRYETSPTESNPYPPSTLYVMPALDQAAVRVAGTTTTATRSVRAFRWASDGRHVVVQQETNDGQGYHIEYTASVFDARDPVPTLIPLGWVPGTVEAVPDLFIP